MSNDSIKLCLLPFCRRGYIDGCQAITEREDGSLDVCPVWAARREIKNEMRGEYVCPVVAETIEAKIAYKAALGAAYVDEVFASLDGELINFSV